MTSRREFLVRCSQLGVAAAVIPEAVLAERIPRDLVSLDRLSFAAFVQNLQSPFAVDAGLPEPVLLELVEAIPWRSSSRLALQAPDARNEKFSLLFRGPSDPLLGQHMYVFQRENLGSFVMFIAPILSTDQEHYYYQAVFNRPSRRTKPIAISPIYPGSAPSSLSQ